MLTVPTRIVVKPTTTACICLWELVIHPAHYRLKPCVIYYTYAIFSFVLTGRRSFSRRSQSHQWVVSQDGLGVAAALTWNVVSETVNVSMAEESFKIKYKTKTKQRERRVQVTRFRLRLCELKSGGRTVTSWRKLILVLPELRQSTHM